MVEEFSLLAFSFSFICIFLALWVCYFVVDFFLLLQFVFLLFGFFTWAFVVLQDIEVCWVVGNFEGFTWDTRTHRRVHTCVLPSGMQRNTTSATPKLPLSPNPLGKITNLFLVSYTSPVAFYSFSVDWASSNRIHTVEGNVLGQQHSYN